MKNIYTVYYKDISRYLSMPGVSHSDKCDSDKQGTCAKWTRSSAHGCSPWAA